MDDFFLDAGGGKSIYATINEKGVVEFAIEAGKGSSMPGREMFKQMMEHFGDYTKGIRGNWTYGDNLGAVNQLTKTGVSLDSAVLETWTGNQAMQYGFKSATVEVAEGVAGNYTKLQVLFLK